MRLMRAGDLIPWLFLFGCFVSAAGQTSVANTPVLFTVVDENGVAVSGAEVALQEPGHAETRFSTDYAGHGTFILLGNEPTAFASESPDSGRRCWIKPIRRFEMSGWC
jgi:hypothetical protein